MRPLRSLIVAAVAAVATPAAATAAAEEMTLDFPTYQLQQSFGPWWTALVEAYEAQHPGIAINLTNSPSNDHHANLATRFIGGNPPDIVHMTARFLWGHAANGFVEPVDACFAGTDIAEAWIPDQQRLTIDGQVYGLLLLTYSFGLYYNAAMLEAAGVAVPTTLEELRAAAEALTLDRDGDGRIDQHGLPITTAPSSWGFVGFMHFHTARDRDIVMNGELDSVEEIAETLTIINDLVTSGASPRQLDLNPMRQVFWQGNGAMYIDGSWAQGFSKSRASEEVAEEWSVAPLPFRNMAAGPSNVLAIPSGLSEARREAVCNFLRLAATPEWQQRYATLTGNPAGRKNSVTEEARSLWPGLSMFEEAAARDGLRSHMPLGFESDFNEFASIVMDGVGAMLSTGLSPEEAAQRIHEALSARFFES